MCGIFALLSAFQKTQRSEFVLHLIEGLQRLEYRGYDSAGVCIGLPEDNTANVVLRTTGRVKDLRDFVMASDLNFEDVLEIETGIAHTRWATNGEPSEMNSHPHTDSENNFFAVVHNGIITNADAIRKQLAADGVVLRSDTDTEVVPILLERTYQELVASGKVPSLTELVRAVLPKLEGAYGIVVRSQRYPNEIVGVRKASPLIFGLQTFESFPEEFKLGDTITLKQPFKAILSSDVAAVIPHTRSVVYLEEGDIVHVTPQCITYNSVETMRPEREFSTVDIDIHKLGRGGYPHFMKKEIFEQAETLSNCMRGRVDDSQSRLMLRGIEQHSMDLINKSHVYMFACGTSYHSAMASKRLFMECLGVPVQVELASEVLDRQLLLNSDAFAIFISQSGETADTLRCLEYTVAQGVTPIGITNTVGSSLVRQTVCGVNVMAGPEVGVASTKAYTNQIMALILLALYLHQVKTAVVQELPKIDLDAITDALAKLPEDVDAALALDGSILSLSQWLGEQSSIFVASSNRQLATALEGALKIKEISYIHTIGEELTFLLPFLHQNIVKNKPCTIIVVATSDILDDDVEAEALRELLELCVNHPNQKQKYVFLTSENVNILQDYIEPISGKPHELFEEQISVLPIPTTHEFLQSIVNVVPLQLISYYVSTLLGIDVDFPRNLAKSVTVE
ncbi:hypothetical protein PCE1_001088 [Barthelona sp. PCE]